jgi:hypothetical protein
MTPGMRPHQNAGRGLVAPAPAPGQPGRELRAGGPSWSLPGCCRCPSGGERGARPSGGERGSETHQVFGTWSGRCRTDDGLELVLDGLQGFAEEARQVW